MALKGMAHIITMLTSIEHIDIGEYKKPLHTLKASPFTRFLLLFFPKNKHQIP